MKKNNKTSMLLLLAVFACLAASCEKETLTLNDNVSNNNQIETKDIIKFDNMDEYTKVLDSVLSMNDLELKLYEESMGYISFGRECDEFYENIDFEKFTTKEELLSFVDNNSDYLVITEDEEGELYIETPFSTNSRRYLMNKDRLFMIGETYYKVFEDGLVSAEENNLEELKQIKVSSIGAFESTHSLQVIKSKREIIDVDSKDNTHNCGTCVEVKKTRDRYRTRVRLSLSMEQGIYANNYYTNITCEFVVRPLKKTLGVWYFCGRTISGDVKVAYDVNLMMTNNGIYWLRRTFHKTNPGRGDSKWKDGYSYTIDGEWRNNHHIAGYDIWAETPSVPRLEMSANKEIL